MSEEESVKVAVRVRVIKKVEKGGVGRSEEGTRVIIRMKNEDQGSRTWIEMEEGKDEKMFNFDYSFQSCDPDPAFCERHGPYATQDTVYDTMGRPLVNAALEGRNVCLFAYGQTGAGKSFSMLGRPGAPDGIVPRAVGAMFENLKTLPEGFTGTITMSVIEIYMKEVHDLLIPKDRWGDEKLKAGLKPRFEGPDKGYSVVSTELPITAVADVAEIIHNVDGNRTIASHALNPNSSRAHTLYTVVYKRVKKELNKATGQMVATETLESRLVLIDLAGSEKTTVAKTSGQLLEEGNAINLSLSALGNCIRALAEADPAKKPQFRETLLTQLLQRSMVNGRVIMIAALSPSELCRAESISTLQFAERIKQVKVRSSINIKRNPVDEINAEMERMRAEFAAKVAALEAGGAVPASLGGGGGADIAKLREEEEERAREFQKQLAALQQSNEEAEAAARKQVAEQRQKWRESLGGAEMTKAEDVKVPMLVNLHEDPRLSETLVYPLKEAETVLGRGAPHKPGTPPPPGRPTLCWWGRGLRGGTRL